MRERVAIVIDILTEMRCEKLILDVRICIPQFKLMSGAAKLYIHRAGRDGHGA
jgi:hypothetical protein